MDSKYWKSSPFGENSLFSPKWDAAQNISSQKSGRIVSISAKKGDYTTPTNNSPSYYALQSQSNRYSSNNTSGSKRVEVTIFVKTEGVVECVYISIGTVRKRAIDVRGQYCASFSVEIPDSEIYKNIEVSAQITDFIGKEIYDERSYEVMIGVNGDVSVFDDDEYTIVNGFVQGKNVSTYRPDNHVKSAGSISKPILAIVLHRTAGASISGAISHNIGTHFYIEGNRNPQKDGEIFQAISLEKYSNHIFNEKNRLSHFEVKTNNSIGIEVVGLAYFKKNGILYQNYGNKNEVINVPSLTKAYIDKNGIENFWEPLTEAQIKSVVALVKLLMKEYAIKPEMVLTHEEIQSKTAGEGQAVKDAIFEYLINN